jgi:KaiC/GvpD/RAD55 family RecA-like ATPase/DNA-binding response OmpR family regulator
MNETTETRRDETAQTRPTGERVSSPSEPPRLISGIDLIDGTGGLYPQKAYVVKGAVGLGKSIVGLQFLTRGLELQEPGVLVTSQKPESVLQQARALGFPLDEAIRRGQLTILNTSNRYFELVETPADVMAIVEELGEYIRKSGAQRLVIDPVYSLITTAYSSHFAVTVAQSLLNALEELPVTSLLIAGDEENPELTPVVRVLEQNSSGVISLSGDRNTGGRLMRLSKFRYGSNENAASHYRILNGRGILNYRGEGETVVDITQPLDEAAARRTVMVLGSNPETIRKVREALGDRYEITAESDFHEGVDRIRKDRPGLVLVTPSRSLQSINAILELARDSSSSVAFLSPATNRTTDKVFYLRAGADDFITEPFTPAEFQARVDALVRRSGRRPVLNDVVSSISADEMTALLQTDAAANLGVTTDVLTVRDKGGVTFDPKFRDRLQRSIDTVSKFDMHFALYWMKSNEKSGKYNKTLAQLCRQEDIICRNVRGEFVALLTGTDENGVKGFEARLREKLGDAFQNARHGYALYKPGESIDSFTEKAASATA